MQTYIIHELSKLLRESEESFEEMRFLPGSLEDLDYQMTCIRVLRGAIKEIEKHEYAE